MKKIFFSKKLILAIFWPKMAEKILFFYLFIFWSTVVPFGLILGMVMSNHKRNTINFTFWWFDPPFGQKRPKMAKKVFFFHFFIFFIFFLLNNCSVSADFIHSDEESCKEYHKFSILVIWPPKRVKKGQKGPKNRQNMQKSRFLTLWSKLTYLFHLEITLNDYYNVLLHF